MTHYSFEQGAHVALFGATGGIGNAILNEFLADTTIEKMYAFSRKPQSYDDKRVVSIQLDLTDEDSIKNAANQVEDKLDMVFIATGLLHAKGLEPEKSMRQLSSQNFQRAFDVNTIGPALVGKYFLPKMRDDRKSVFAALSARVGSISDNNAIGGWYAYRAAKAALNMVLKNFAIEAARKNKNLVVTGLQPGTVDTQLSKPFQQHVKKDKLFTTEHCAKHLLKTLNNLSSKDSGKLFDWNGTEFDP